MLCLIKFGENVVESQFEEKIRTDCVVECDDERADEFYDAISLKNKK